MTQNYLPNRATVAEACDWLREQTKEPWTLARLLECGLMPWFWLEYQPGWPDALFGGRAEGYLAPLCFAGDTDRLAADGRDVLVTMTRTHDGQLLKVGPPGFHFPIDELRFLRGDINQLAAQHDTPAAGKVEAAPVASHQSDWREQTAPVVKAGTNKKTWDDAKLRALWDESLQPGVTNAILAKRHGVSRQRIGTLLAQSKSKFSTSGKAASSKYAGLMTTHKMKS